MTYLSPDGREPFFWVFDEDLPDGAVVEVSIGGAWHTLEMDGRVGSLCLAGPDATSPNAVTVNADEYLPVRVTAQGYGGPGDPDIIVRGGGAIQLDRR
ncbi:hypothetical protein LLS1_18310 [Leifsonia sp. LS1]|uniref:hypothetical protein n=1 Tax=Leifsonia sp. LS1 TaxID=2828483 RepID=UPI001CFDF899|nr:hypothetical protein [Leifsonia sp. LS1]GIT80162.1 hypothetical protein LLS1_18310 [Leifsonia sp. LS1]